MAKLKPKSFNDIYDSDSIYNLEQAIEIVKKASYVKFDESVDLAINLNVDPRHAEQNIRVTTSLPKGTGKKMVLLVLAQGEKVQEVLSSLSNTAGEEAAHVAAINEVLDASIMEIPTISAVGYAVVSVQPGRTPSQKRLMAIRSARMAAMRDLAEQVHGLKVEGNTTVIDLMVQNDTFRGIVSGTIRGARTVRINPNGGDTYEVVLEIDTETLSFLLKQARAKA